MSPHGLEMVRVHGTQSEAPKAGDLPPICASCQSLTTAGNMQPLLGEVLATSTPLIPQLTLEHPHPTSPVLPDVITGIKPKKTRLPF